MKKQTQKSQPTTILSEHIPPDVTFSDGSLEIEAPTINTIDIDNNRHRVYHFKRNGFTVIKKVLVIAIPDDRAKQIEIHNREFSAGNPEVKIWLETVNGAVYHPVPSVPSGEPQIVIRHNTSTAGPPQLVIESDKDIGQANSKPNHPDKHDRTQKYKHSGYATDVLFRIAKVAISTGDPIPSLPRDRFKVHVLIWFGR